MVNYYLMQHDHPPLVFFECNRDEYFAALDTYDVEEDLEPLEKFLRRMVEDTWKTQLWTVEQESQKHKPLTAFAGEAPC